MVIRQASARIAAMRVPRCVLTRDFKACPSFRYITNCACVYTWRKVSESAAEISYKEPEWIGLGFKTLPVCYRPALNRTFEY